MPRTMGPAVAADAAAATMPAPASARAAGPVFRAADTAALVPAPTSAERTPTSSARTPAPTSSARTPNVRLRACREDRGWSQERLATELRRFAAVHEGREAGVTGNMICKWEKGDKKPSYRYQRLLRALFNRSSVELGFVDDVTNVQPRGVTSPPPGMNPGMDGGSLPRVDVDTEGVLGAACTADNSIIPVERRGFLRLVAAAGGVAVVPSTASGEPWERLSAALRQQSPVTPALVDELARRTAGLYGLEERVPARSLMNRVTTHLDTLSRLLTSGTRTSARRELASTAGETAALAGWLCFDMNDVPTALAYYRVAVEAAREADDEGLWACVLGYESYQPGLVGHHDKASALLVEAQRRAARGGTLMTRAWLAAREAEEQAARGEARAAIAALERAQDAFERATPDNDRVWTAFFDRGRLDGLKVTTYTRLRRSRDAFTAATEALRAAGPAATKKRSLLLGDVADVHVQRGDLDAACQHAADALAIIAQTDFSLGLARIRKLRERLTPWADTQPVRDLDEQIRVLSPTDRPASV